MMDGGWENAKFEERISKFSPGGAILRVPHMARGKGMIDDGADDGGWRMERMMEDDG